MKTLYRRALRSAVVFMSCGVLFAADAPAPATAPAPAPPVVLVNFTETVPGISGYGSWKGNFAVAANAGMRVQGNKGADGSGGFCASLDPARDLDGCVFVEVAVSVQPGNEVPSYQVVLSDADKTSCSARIHVGQLMPGQPVWLRLKKSDFAVSTRDPGKDGKMDWRKVAGWHLQGDWGTKKPAQILFIAFRARS